VFGYASKREISALQRSTKNRCLGKGEPQMKKKDTQRPGKYKSSPPQKCGNLRSEKTPLPSFLHVE
jgi:hypothetical protein